jgi:hypothetical protein
MSSIYDFTLKNEGSHPFGYVPVRKRRISESFRGTEGEVIGNSGVTIGIGLDLGQREHLADLKLPKEIETKLSQYLGLKKEKAQEKLKSNPLEITKEEEVKLNQCVMASYISYAKNCFNRFTGKDFFSLDEKKQTLVFDLVYQHGNIFTPKHPLHKQFAEIIASMKDSADWKEAKTKLANLDNGYKNRNILRAGLV